MRMNTMVTLGASAAFGLTAVLLARGWISGAVADEFRQTRAPATLSMPQMPDVPMTSVVVANADLLFGDHLSPDVLRVVQMPEDAVPLDALRSLDDLFDPSREFAAFEDDAPQPYVMLADVAMNEVLLPHRVSGLGGRGSLSARIRTGYRAVSIRVDDVSGVAGFVVPGDLVDVQYVTEQLGRKASNFRSDIILQSVRVLAVDQTSNQQVDAPTIARTITLEVSHMDAQALAVASESGQLSLVLRATGEALPTTTKSFSSRQLDARANSLSATKKPKRPTRVTPKPKPKPVANITVIRGDTRQSVSVRKEDTTSISSELAGG